MDIAGPQPREMAAPPPRTVVRQNIDKEALVRQVLRHHPDASVEEVVDELAHRHISVNGIFVSRIKQREASHREEDEPARRSKPKPR